jgi:putative oxidoreductase
MDIGVLLLRVVIGGLFFGHGTQKLFGWFGGHGLDGTAGFVGSLGLRPPRLWAAINGMVESGAGVLLALGLLTPLAAAGIVGVMMVAVVTVHWPKGVWNTNGGYELNLVMAAGASAVAFIGPGAYSLDSALGWTLAGRMWGGLAVLGGVITASATLAVRALASKRDAKVASEERHLSRAA